MPDLSSSLRDLIDGSMRSVDIDAIVRTRRRRRFRRRSAVAGVFVVIAAVVTGSVLARPATEPKVLSVGGSGDTGVASGEAAATRAELAQMTIVSPSATGVDVPADLAAGPVELTDPQSVTTRRVPFPVSRMRSDGDPVVVGSNIVMLLDSPESDSSVSDAAAYVMSSTFDQWRSIESATAVFPSLDPARVWLVSFGKIIDTNLDGTATSSYPLTDGRRPIAAVTGGLLTSRAVPNSVQQVLEVWDPATNRVVRTLPNDASVVAAQGDAAVLDVCPKACARELYDLRSGNARLLTPPANEDWGSEAAFSPDGKQLALVAHAPLTPHEAASQSPFPPSGSYASSVSVVDVATGAQTRRRVTTWKGATRVAWSPDGSLVFLARAPSTVDYFNTTYEHGPVRELAVPGAAGFLLAAAPAPSTSTQRYAYDGLISQSLQHSAELCVYATADIGIGDDNCSGPAVAGWDWSKVKAKTTSGGIISGKYHLIGTYDGNEFTLTQSPTAAQPVRPAPPSYKTTCPAPAGGWRVTNPGLVGFDDYNALMSAARGAPDFSGLWIDSSTEPPGAVNDFPREVFNVGFTGHLDEHRLQLAAAWGGPICVVEQPRPYSELQNISHLLFGAYGQSLGLQMIDAGPDEARNVVRGDAVAVSPATQRALDQRFGKGVVDLTSALRPVG